MPDSRYPWVLELQELIDSSLQTSLLELAFPLLTTGRVLLFAAGASHVSSQDPNSAPHDFPFSLCLQGRGPDQCHTVSGLLHLFIQLASI